jgi:hypothetical protein
MASAFFHSAANASHFFALQEAPIKYVVTTLIGYSQETQATSAFKESLRNSFCSVQSFTSFPRKMTCPNDQCKVTVFA